MKKVTIKDVAMEAGVSISVVSYVLNGATKPSISAATKERVMEAVNRLGYIPNRNAAILRSGKSHTIGIVSYWEDSYIHKSFMDGIAAAAETQGYRTLTFLASKTTEVMDYTKYVKDHMFDGIVVIPPYESRRNEMNFCMAEHVEYMNDNKIPFVVLGDAEKEVAAAGVGINYRRAAYLATKYFISKGYKDVFYVTKPMDMMETCERYKGYCQAIEEHDLKPQLCLDSEIENNIHNFKAVVANKSKTARSVMLAADKLGMRIPDDFELIAANAEYFSKYMIPPLTTVSFPAREMGAKAVETLLEILNGQKVSGVTVLEHCNLDLRGTTK